MYTYMYICIYVYMYTCIYVYMCICMYVHMYICMYVYMCNIYIYNTTGQLNIVCCVFRIIWLMLFDVFVKSAWQGDF